MNPLKLNPPTHTVEIAGEPVELPLVALNESLGIALLIVVDMGVRFGDRVGKALAQRLAAAQADIVVGTATLGIPVAIEVSRHLSLDRYLILQKSPKIHLRDALVEEVRSITSVRSQVILLDRRAVPLLSGQRVIVVDDVVTTGSSLSAALKLVRQAGGQVVGIGVILTEGYTWRAQLGEDAGLVTALGHIPQFTLDAGNAVVDPLSL
jgi:adenine/guanine phosphoribosyltransferase-like PRPP-binding protein